MAGCIFWLCSPKKEEGEEGIARLALGQVEEAMCFLWCPVLSYAQNTETGGIWQFVTAQFPFLHAGQGEGTVSLQWESRETLEDIIRAEGRDEYSDSLSEGDMRTPLNSQGRVSVGTDLEKLLQEENNRAQKREEEEAIPKQDKSGQKQGEEKQEAEQQENGEDGIHNNVQEGLVVDLPKASQGGKTEDYQWEYYKKYDALVKEFYAVDASTVIDSSQLNLDTLLGKDFSIAKRQDDLPQILVYHTHSQEDFVNSVEGDMNTTIMGVGEVLTQILEEQYGYNVMHHLGQYDVENRDYAYNNSLPALEQLLAENPSIEVVIDLHRDEVAGDRKLVTQIEGRPTAMFMFFNGLSRTRKHGDIEYLPNENLSDNLAFSFQMQALCNEYYPGLTRRIYLKGYRYNMHLKARYLLIEMGAQTNTYEECYNACIPLARVLDMELSGTDFGYGG